jgi:uncharacterized protein YabN with tetrapyrrole methylase and pyrophosphatase domain
MNILEKALHQGRVAAEIGFDWNDALGVMTKIEEETQELRVAIEENEPKEILHEIGDVLLALCSLSRHCNISLEQALELAVARFDARWNTMHTLAQAQGVDIKKQNSDALEKLWMQAKEQLST